MPKNLQQVNYQKIKSTLFNNLRIKEDLRGITKKKKQNKTKTMNGIKMKTQHQILWDTVKSSTKREIFSTKKEKISHINNLSTYLKNLEKETQNKLK